MKRFFLIILLSLLAIAPVVAQTTYINVSPTTLPTATVGVAYTQAITGVGGIAPYTCRMHSETARAYIQNCILTWIPESVGSYSIQVRVSDSSSPPLNHIQKYTLTVVAATPKYSLTWAPSVSPGVAGYNVYLSTVSGGPYTQLNSSMVTAQPYVFPCATTCYIVMTAVTNSDGQSGYSNQAQTP